MATLIRLMGELGVDEPAVRSSISRLKRRGILVAERVGRRPATGCPTGSRDPRRGRPSDLRAAPREPRRRLAAGGVQRPGDRAREAAHAALPAGLAGLRDRGGGRLDRAGPPPRRDARRPRAVRPHRVRRPVPGRLPGLRRRREQVATGGTWTRCRTLYDEFLEAYAPVLARWRRRRTIDDAQAFADYVRALTAWRRLPYLDPGLPAECCRALARRAGGGPLLRAPGAPGRAGAPPRAEVTGIGSAGPLASRG